MRAIRDFSYRARRIAGPGWVLAGDAFGFIDPIYSTGLFLTMFSAELAGTAVVEALAETIIPATDTDSEAEAIRRRRLERFGANP